MKAELRRIVMELPLWGIVTSEDLLLFGLALGMLALVASAYALSQRVKQP
jgi:hypothetical protein